ncbi:MAG: ATP-binding protein [Halobacteriales archaeon]
MTITVSQNSESVQIAIADHGPCIPEVERDLLSDRTKQTQLDHGSGLGLWLVKLITARSGGTITIEENSPVGNIVSIDISRAGTRAVRS